MSYMEQAEAGRLDCRAREVPPSDAAFEFMLNALRLQAGFRAADYTSRTGLSLEWIADRLVRAERKGMIESIDGPGWRPTALGSRFLDDLTAMFLP